MKIKLIPVYVIILILFISCGGTGSEKESEYDIQTEDLVYSVSEDRDVEKKTYSDNESLSSECSSFIKDNTALYDFELSIQDDDYNKEIARFGNKVADVLNQSIETDTQISVCDMQLLEKFADIFAETVKKKKFPDFSVVFDLKNEIRKENMFLIEAFAYQESILSEGIVAECYNELKIFDVEVLSENVREVFFQFSQEKSTQEGIKKGFESVGYMCIADIIDTDTGPKMVHFWMDSPGLNMLRKKIISSKILSKEAGVEIELEKMVRERIEYRRERTLNAQPGDVIPDD